MVSPARLFRRCRRRLDAACLGALEIDALGDVNASKRGRGVRRYVGPGGFVDFAAAARTLVIVSGWMRGGEMAVEGAAVRIRRRGTPKFVRRVAEVTLSAARALAAGKRILYVTPVGVFRRTACGMELVQVMPGIDVHRDIVEVTPIDVALPASGEVPVVPSSIVTGRGFRLPRWGSAARPGTRSRAGLRVERSTPGG
jgi:propionate CoA-transferase